MPRPARAPLPRRELALGALVAAAGLPGLLPGAAGAADPLALLAWLTWIAAPVGVLVAAHGLRLWPLGLAAPASWILLIVWSDLASARDLATPAWAAACVVGLYGLGFGLGRILPRRPWALAGVLLLMGVVLSGLPAQGGLSAGADSWARTHPRFAALLLDLSPLVLVAECAGWDWTRAHPAAYALAGVEWFPRTPWRGLLAGPTALLVGCTFAALATRLARTPAR